MSQASASLPLLALVAGSAARRVLAPIEAAASTRGAQVTVLDLEAAGLPLYGEQAKPNAAVISLRDTVGRHAALMIVAPEVFGGPAPALVNALAWLGTAATPRPLAGKVLALAAPANDDGHALRPLNQLAANLGALGALVLPYPIGVAGGTRPDATLDAPVVALLEQLGAALVDATRRFAGVSV